MAALNFDATQVKPAEPFEVIPAGNYLALIEDSDLKPTKAGNGTILELKLSILDGPYANRKLFVRLNVQHTNQQAQDIGQRQLSQLCHAVGKLHVQDSAELHMIPFIARVVVTQDKTGQYGDRNEVREFKPVGNAAPAPATRPAFQPSPVAAPVPPPVAASGGNGKKPAWVK
jgi:hypothetical protein